MPEPEWEKDVKRLEFENSAIFDSFDRWSPETAEELNDLLRALRRKKGFGLFFVQCNPAQATQIIKAIRERFSQKRLAQFELNRQSETLYGELLERYQTEKFEIACVTGVEQALYSYEDTKRLAGWSDEEIYNYSWKGVPPLLSHLNRQRETFEANLPFALIFLVRSFTINYFVQRAPDFFDWRSGFFKFSDSWENEENDSQLVGKAYKEYRTLTSEQRMESILEIKDKVLQLDPSESEQKSKLLQEQGRLFESNEDLKQALDCYERALNANSQNHQVYQSKGIVLFQLGRYEEAIKSYDRALEIDQYNHSFWNTRSLCLFTLGKYEEALASVDRALEIEGDTHYLWMNRGNMLDSLKRYEEAIESYDRALAIKPDFYYVWVNRGYALIKLERYEEAIESYDRALAIKPESYYVWTNRGNALLQLERYEEAIESYDQTLSSQNKNCIFWKQKGIALTKISQYKEAIETYNEAIKFNQDCNCAYFYKGNILLNLKQYEQAILSYDRALAIKPESYYAWTNRGNALLQLKRYTAAIESYDKAIEIKEDYYYAWRNRCYALARVNQYREATKSYKKVLLYQPDSEGEWIVQLSKWIYKLLEKASTEQPKWYKILDSIFTKIYSLKLLWYILAKIQPSNSLVWNSQGYLALSKYSYGMQPNIEKPLLIRQVQDCRVFQHIHQIDLQDCQKALNYFKIALNIDSKDCLIWANQSFPEYYLEQYQSALQSCDKSLELNLENEEEINEVVHSNRGNILLQLDNPTAALQDFTTALEIDPKLSEAWNGQGTALYQLGRYTEALHSFTEALKLNHPLAQTNLNLISCRVECPS